MVVPSASVVEFHARFLPPFLFGVMRHFCENRNSLQNQGTLSLSSQQNAMNNFQGGATSTYICSGTQMGCFHNSIMAFSPPASEEGTADDDRHPAMLQPTPFHPSIGRPTSVVLPRGYHHLINGETDHGSGHEERLLPLQSEATSRNKTTETAPTSPHSLPASSWHQHDGTLDGSSTSVQTVQEKGATDLALLPPSSLPMLTLIHQQSLDEQSSVRIVSPMQQAEQTTPPGSHPNATPGAGRLQEAVVLPTVLPFPATPLEHYNSELPCLPPVFFGQRWQQLQMFVHQNTQQEHDRQQIAAEQGQHLSLYSLNPAPLFGQGNEQPYLSVRLEPYEGDHRQQKELSIVSTEEESSCCDQSSQWLFNTSDEVVPEISESQSYLSSRAKEPGAIDSKTVRSTIQQGTKKLPPASSRLAKTTGRREILSPPVKPLNSRNFFYIEMRTWLLSLDDTQLQRLLYGLPPAVAAPNSVDSCSAGRVCAAFLAENGRLSREERMARLLSSRQNKCRQPRKHRRVHGKLSFNQINALINVGWKVMPERDREFYRNVTNADRERYEIESLEFEDR